MTCTPPTSDTPPGPERDLEDRLASLAAGELDEAEARRLRDRLAADPALAARHARAERLERALRSLEPLPLPPGLVERVLFGLPGRRRVSGAVAALARLAAAVLLAFGAWMLTVGSAPRLAEAEPPPILREALAPALEVVPRPPLDATALSLAAAPVEAPSWVLGAAGALVLALGLLLARRVNRGTPSRRPGPPPPETSR